MIDTRLKSQLLRQYKENGSLIIAFDYDDTVFPYNVSDDELLYVRYVLRKAKKQGHTLICFTCRDSEDKVGSFCLEHGILYDWFNESPVKLKEVGLGKIYYNIFLDDKAGLELATNTLLSVLLEIEEGEK